VRCLPTGRRVDLTLRPGLQQQRVAGTGAERRVVEDAPGRNAAAAQVTESRRELVKKFVFIGRVIHARRAMQPEIRETAPSAGLAIVGGTRWIRGHARDLEILEQAIGAILEPAHVPGFERNAAIEAFSERREEGPR